MAWMHVGTNQCLFTIIFFVGAAMTRDGPIWIPGRLVWLERTSSDHRIINLSNSPESAEDLREENSPVLAIWNKG